ncbi:MAG: hypothetical protein ACK4SY_06785 [Pyrobaculum sp.]
MELYRGKAIYSLAITGIQGTGKSRLLSLLALLLKERGFNVYYDIGIPTELEQYDYILLDDIAAMIHSSEHMTHAGRTLRKIEILVRNIARHGYLLAAPRSIDVLRQIRITSHILWLRSSAEVREIAEEEVTCDVVAVYTNYDGDIFKEFCITWEKLKIYGFGSPRWRQMYEPVQQKRAEILKRLLDQFKTTVEGVEVDGGEKEKKILVERCFKLFMMEKVELCDDCVSNFDELYVAYKEFCERRKMPYVKPHIFSRMLTQYGIRRGSKRWVLIGLRLV